MTNNSYKEMHEAFMQNFNGTTAVDTFVTIIPVFFTSTLLKYTVLSYGIINFFSKILLEFIIVVVPIVFGTTIGAEFRYYTFLTFLLLFCFAYSCNLIGIKTIWNLKVQHKKHWHCITYVRALVSLATIHCILAVDFDIFPRYMAKTEKFGYSLMDMGVGLFVFCNALVPSKISRHSILNSLEQIAKSCFVLFILGYARTTIIKEIDYHEHITEYGLHWNFFITLAITKLMATIIMHYSSENRALISGTILLFIHEVLLHNGISSWVYSNMIRDNFLSANREGIASCIGYVALYLISAHVGQIIREKISSSHEREIIKKLLIVILLSWLTTYISNILFGVSRCLANLGYCSFIIAVGTTMLTMFYLFELSEISQITGRHAKQKLNDYHIPIILHAINKNGLLFFLLGNMVTGLINILFETLLLNTLISLNIIFLYMIFMIMVIVSWENNKFIK